MSFQKQAGCEYLEQCDTDGDGSAEGLVHILNGNVGHIVHIVLPVSKA